MHIYLGCNRNLVNGSSYYVINNLPKVISLVSADWNLNSAKPSDLITIYSVLQDEVQPRYHMYLFLKREHVFLYL